MSTGDDRSLRAGNADREKVVAHLNTAFSEGRLDVAELDERVAAAYAAKTLGELVPLTADLPPPAADLPATSRTTSAPARREARPPQPHGPSGATRWAPVSGALGIFLVCTLIWAAVSIGSGDLTYFWPIWTAIPLVFAMVGVIGQSSAGRRDDRRDRRR